jgi:hypothetical protein
VEHRRRGDAVDALFANWCARLPTVTDDQPTAGTTQPQGFSPCWYGVKRAAIRRTLTCWPSWMPAAATCRQTGCGSGAAEPPHPAHPKR